MEDWQKSAILRNIDKLIELTVCNISLLAKLQANGMLSKNDADKLSVLGSSQSSHSQSYELYNIISTRKDGYQKLIACLRETLQTGAVEILTTEETKWKTTGLDDILSITYDEKIQLGMGSNGTIVYKGKLGNRDVAVKRVNSDVTKATMIIREVENLKICDIHTNIVRYFGSKQTHNSLLIVLELCDMTLKDWVFNNKSIDMLPFEILRQITSGLDWLHKRRIVHRDLKPENILLLAQVKQVKISDFGLSRTISEERSCVSSAGFGTQGWVAPEVLAQIDSEDGKNCQFTFASDVFSLGCVFYYVITDGKHPFGSLVMRNANILKGNHTMDPNEGFN
ncbi:Serine/threonine-protein kinase/endoribonuclease IRE1 [Orchesella cincta]|uniref:non-specific serine/threonine protein kinase n=1 Tax=Orchesella cincta TaxID=48709 RepID=A0A1D2NMT8_ORCCI|nr:Serine/threonine-protein kinase/endoribonuclease IRE1 [Orchesella cincta]